MKKINEKNKKKKIVIITIFLIFLFITIILFAELIKIKKEEKHQREITEQVKQQVSQYTKVSDFKSIQEVLVYLNSEFISQQDAEEDNLDYIVKAKLKYDLKINNKNYYENLINYSASACGYKNFYIIDEEKNIQILVQCNNSKISNYYINNEKFYFEKLENKENINNSKKTNEIKVNTTNLLLQEIIKNNWEATNINIGTKESMYKGYDIYFDEGYEIKKIYGKIYNIVFTEKYKENIIENINTTSEKEKITNLLGTPQFQINKCIGYKTEKYYIFFTDNQISIYPVIQYSAEKIIPIIEEYKETKDTKKYINNIKSIWNDYDKFITENNSIILQYTLKGIIFKYDGTSTQGIQLYSNYNSIIDGEHTLEDVKNKIVDLPEYMSYINQNLIFEEEINRIYSQDNYTEKDNFASENVLNTSNKFKAYQDIKSKQFCIVSINKQVPNSELKEEFDWGIWHENNKFIYSVQNKGIYIYNAEERKYSTLVEGKDEFKIVKIENNKLYYDEKMLEL